MDLNDYLRYFYIFSQLGFVVVVSIVIFIYLGNYIDKNIWHTGGVFTVLGIFLGIFSAGFNSYKIYKKYIDELEKIDRNDRDRDKK
ncbi:MAG: AtpZ/AtpI family protein [Candidatus Mcinerneyibacterium aminivorans]|uniref:AtpZ/AtpI family protein n=1 Tax=Candidatus Mcinerneyibacterium aminivorans TaxID=2703815 RepID=A0A5D0MNL5_9BACT|nr:MAG: AtpZ/AtpI family protein [Candidatus Mcinerneyibacterium aminivorans]